RGHGDGPAGRQHDDEDRSHRPDRHGGGPPVRHPRGWPDRGGRKGHEDHQVSCYTRNLGDWLPPEPTWSDRRALDAAIREELGMADADCPEVWEAVKAARQADPAMAAPGRGERGWRLPGSGSSCAPTTTRSSTPRPGTWSLTRPG